jgi:mRNA interferase MazF
MTTYNIGDVLVAKFPFADIDKYKPRPVVVISEPEFNKENQHCVVAMVTTAEKTVWAEDLKISNLKSAGLNTESYVRAKLFTLDNRLITKSIGRLSGDDADKLQKKLKKLLAF